MMEAMNKCGRSILVASMVGVAGTGHAREFFVGHDGNDQNDGTATAPLRTISAAARLAQPGDTITVREGVYRERINPPRGGTSDAQRIVYRAAPGEKVVLKGSEPLKGWRPVTNDTWSVTVPDAFFGDFNPFHDRIRGDWFNGQGRAHHTGAVYLNGHWLMESASLARVQKPVQGEPLWFATRGSDARVEAARFVKQSGLKADAAQGEEGTGTCIGWISNGHWALYDRVDFGEGAETLEFRAASATAGGVLEIRLDAHDGALLGRVTIPNTGGWQTWRTFDAPIQRTAGTHAVALVFRAPPQSADPYLMNVAWFQRKEADTQASTTLWAQFKGVNPNEADVEINVRQSVFYPSEPGRNFITVRGFRMMHAATNWAPPTAEQIGLIGTHWSKGWIIEDNEVSHSTCTGITLGKHGDAFDNMSADTAEGYVLTIDRALKKGWSKENIGSHLVRRNLIHHCEQAGLVGSMGGAFSTIEDNVIRDINTRQMLAGAELAGIKLHAGIDTVIRRNHIYRVPAFGGGIWLDWMTQGTRVTGNLMHDNSKDLFLEVNHGPFLVDHNIFLSPLCVWDWSQGGAFVHNLFGGMVTPLVDSSRQTPYHLPHSTTLKGLTNIRGGDHRFYNNLFTAGDGLRVYDAAQQPVFMEGNVFLKGAAPSKHEKTPTVRADFDTRLAIMEKDAAWQLELHVDPTWADGAARDVITTEKLGRSLVAELPFEQPDGNPYRLDRDYFGQAHGEANPFPGPFARPKESDLRLTVWPVP